MLTEHAETSVVGAYRLTTLLGRGGMGEVWLGEHVMLGRRAAVKLLHNQFSSQPEIVTRFFNEARAATAIADPGIVQIYDFGQRPDGSVYIVMELLDGEPLDRRLASRGSLGIAESLRLVRQVASSLGAAHACGIVHRDLKPENIFVVRDPEVAGGERTKLLDFGIAKLAGDDIGVHTKTSILMGTPAFMSPEQCRGAGQVDQRTDIYSLGCVMFQLITGRPPFDGDAPGELIVSHLRETPPAPSTIVRAVPAVVDRLIASCLAKDPAARPANGTELASAIDVALACVEVAGASLVSLRGPSTRHAVPRMPRRRWLAAAAIVIAAIVLVVTLPRSGGNDVATADAAPASTPPAPISAGPEPEPDIVLIHEDAHVPRTTPSRTDPIPPKPRPPAKAPDGCNYEKEFCP